MEIYTSIDSIKRLKIFTQLDHPVALTGIFAFGVVPECNVLRLPISLETGDLQTGIYEEVNNGDID